METTESGLNHDALRERNKGLLNQLRQHRENREWLSGFDQSRQRERGAEAEARGQPAEMLRLTDGDRGLARAALARPTVKFADTRERQRRTVSTSSLTFKHSGEDVQHIDPSNIFKDSDRHPQLKDTRLGSTKSCLINHVTEQPEERSRVTFQSDKCEELPDSDRSRLQPLLGYDWIAGVLDAEGSSVIQRSDEFFNDLRMFRALNKDECVHRPQVEFSEVNLSGPALLSNKGNPEATTDTHQCTFSYRVNSRLFPVPLHSQECCPVCKKDKSSHPHTTAEPALIRVSIPRFTVLPPYKYKAHRRCSFDPSDSLGLPSHCLSGWLNTVQSTLPPPSSLDLRSSLNMKSSTWSKNNEMEDLSMPKVSSTQTFDQISDVSRLARHKLQHFSPKRKLGSTSYLVC